MLTPNTVTAEMIRLHYEENLTLREIGEMFGITRQAVHSRIKGETLRKESGVYKKKNQETELIAKLYVEEGKSMSEIGKEVGMSAQGISYRLRKFGVKIRSAETVMQKPRPRADS